jgi:hypothetical protein
VRSGSSTVLAGLGASCDAARDAWLTKYGREMAAKECARGFKGKHGCDKNFPSWCASWNLPWGKPAEVAASAYPDYLGADRKLQQFISQIQSCQTSQRDIPSSWKLPAPDGKAPADVVSAYNSYSLRRYQELPEAIADAGVFCSAGSSSGGSSATDPSATNPSAGGWSASFENGSPYGQETAYADIYTPTGATGGTQVGAGSNYGSVVANPYAPPAPATPVRKGHRGAYIGGGAALLAVVAVIAMRGRRKSKRRGAR